MGALVFDKGSFRDPEGRVCSYNNQIYRTLTPDSAKRMESLLALPFFQKRVAEGSLVDTKLLKKEKVFPKNMGVTDHVLWHEKIPHITYPFEWTFSMLKDGARLTLNLMSDLLENNFILKDATAWNICLHKGVPCFYDILSIDAYVEGQPWGGFHQFLQEFLYPLMIQSYQGIDFQPLWYSTLQGIPAKLLYKSLPKSFLFKKGVFKYVYLQEKLASSKTISQATVSGEFTEKVFPKKVLMNLIKDLSACVESLEMPKGESVWENYSSENSYKDADTKKKEKFVGEGLRTLNPSSIIDLGCNSGQYSFIAADIAPVIACDLDPLCIDRIYSQKHRNILPVILNLMTPAASLGWQLNERKDVFTRLKADSFLALALIHHLCIVHNVPLDYFVIFLKSVASKGIVEWVDKSDPMVQFLLRNRKDIFEDYSWESFKKSISKHFVIEKIVPLNDGTRQILLLSAKES